MSLHVTIALDSELLGTPPLSPFVAGVKRVISAMHRF
jgi:hypothetical protein